MRLDVRAFARDGASLSGHSGWDQMPRLRQEQESPVDDPSGTAVSWNLIGQVKDLRGGAHQTWLRVQAESNLRLICQRCLQPMTQGLSVDRPFRFVSSEQAAMAEDDQAEEDLLVASQAFDALTLIEDELILALPIVPRHPECQPPA
ncbi:MAG: hypothetical protein RIT26_1440 [Pseudomonadota bacterium]